MNEKVIWDFLSPKIKNDYGVAGLMGNLFAESSLNPINATGNKGGLTNEQYTAVVDENKNDNFATDGVAYGLVQWRYHTRKKGLLDLARSKKTSVGNIQTQLEYMWQELQSYKTVLNTLYSAKSIREASDMVMLKYEKPGTTTEAAKKKRAEHGQRYYDMFVKVPADQVKVNRSKLEAARQTIGEWLK